MPCDYLGGGGWEAVSRGRVYMCIYVRFKSQHFRCSVPAHGWWAPPWMVCPLNPTPARAPRRPPLGLACCFVSPKDTLKS